MSLFEGRDLACVRGERLVFGGLDFALGPGAALLLVGPNGSGKSSLLRIMAGLTRPVRGQLLWDGRPVGEDPEAHGARLRFVGHHDAVKPVLSVAENLAFWAGQAGTGGAGVADALRRFGLDALAEVPGRLLSAGQKRRLALARLLCGSADLWLLDEPTVGLDRDALAALVGEISAHRSAGGRVVVTTHVPIELVEHRRLDMTDFQVDPLEAPLEPPLETVA